MTNHFKNWVLWTTVAAISSIAVKLLFGVPLDFAIALSLVEIVFWAIVMIPLSWNYTRLFDTTRRTFNRK